MSVIILSETEEDIFVKELAAEDETLILIVDADDDMFVKALAADADREPLAVSIEALTPASKLANASVAEPEIVVAVTPAKSPAVIVTFPARVTVPSCFKWNLEELIWIFPLLPLTNAVDFLPKKIPASLEEELFPSLIGKGLYGYRCEGEFIDIGTPESYSLAADIIKT